MPIEKNNDLPAGNIDVEVESMVAEDMPDIEIVLDPETGSVRLNRQGTVDDTGNPINPMIVEGQIHGGLTQGLAPALFEELIYDEDGNILNGSLMDYLVPTAVETPNWETDQTVTPSPHHPPHRHHHVHSRTV